MLLLDPGSRERVELVSPDPLLAPHFHPNHPNHPDDAPHRRQVEPTCPPARRDLHPATLRADDCFLFIPSNMRTLKNTLKQENRS
ncbi:MAG TPA: hypothetical protein PKA35_03720 [Paracoccus solventivorans]|uniref:hypothetical protein n=1 Tax=Paracoccus solventivorans TaxID=53463 RepID=UPI002CD1303F|nr:hypothetical protein [Paracoccus solventivorans]HMM08212.1 hypothetical protein [Paracoccus solventivorans]